MTTILELNGQPVTHFSNPDRKVKWSKNTIYGGNVYGSLRSIAHLDQTSKHAENRLGHQVDVMQSAYNVGYPPSAGTHDYDAVYDVFISGVEWLDTQRFFRAEGWAAWWRYPPTFVNHVHMISLGYTTRVGIYVPGQVDDYYAHRDGMSGHHPDNTWHPDDIRETIFDYDTWVENEEADMPLNEHDLRQIRQIFNEELKQAMPDIAAEVMGSKVDKEGSTARAALRAAKGTPALIKDLCGDETPPA